VFKIYVSVHMLENVNVGEIWGLYIIAQKGGFVARMLTVRQAVSQLHSKWYERMLA